MGGELTRESMLEWGGLVAAYEAARRGKRRNAEATAWYRDWENRLMELRARLAAGWTFGPYRVFPVRDPKPRLVAAAPFADRIVHHAIVARIEPWLERRLGNTCVACRTGKGLRAGRDAVAKACRDPRSLYFVKCDVRRYFASIRHDVLLGQLEPACGDAWSYELLRSLVGSCHTTGDEGIGIPIGNLTSQCFANLYLSGVDHFMRRTVRVRGCVRYVDDIVWFGEDKQVLWSQLGLLERRMGALGLELHPSKTRVGLVRDGVDFAGVVASRDWLKLRGRSKRRALRHLRWYRRERRARASVSRAYLERLRSFIALAREAKADGILASRGLRWQ